eukprot:GHVU01102988.1.p5 GENE.GHVU01102988.1~~GHVU01102988.1.p5  ORF type:complete len:130 (-),score=1.99 GHVU01102988.1:1624-2013(-)
MKMRINENEGETLACAILILRAILTATRCPMQSVVDAVAAAAAASDLNPSMFESYWNADLKLVKILSVGLFGAVCPPDAARTASTNISTASFEIRSVQSVIDCQSPSLRKLCMRLEITICVCITFLWRE